MNRALREARQEADLTQSDLAEKAGCSQSAISMFEQGKCDVLAQEKVEEIARTKLQDLNCDTLEAAVRVIEGSARSMGIEIVG